MSKLEVEEVSNLPVVIQAVNHKTGGKQGKETQAVTLRSGSKSLSFSRENEQCQTWYYRLALSIGETGGPSARLGVGEGVLGEWRPEHGQEHGHPWQARWGEVTGSWGQRR